MVGKKKLFSSLTHEKHYCITVQGGRRLVMEGVDEILLCDKDIIELRGKNHVRIQGEGLSLVELGNENMEIKGRIKALYFEGWQP